MAAEPALPFDQDFGLTCGTPLLVSSSCLSSRRRVWAKAIHRVAADGISPEQAVDEAIARIKQILAE